MTDLQVLTRRRTYSTTEVAEMVGLSYRMLDYWVRQGYISISAKSRGSGHHRQWTHDEVEALVSVVTRYRNAQHVIEKLQDGILWSEARAS